MSSPQGCVLTIRGRARSPYSRFTSFAMLCQQLVSLLYEDLNCTDLRKVLNPLKTSAYEVSGVACFTVSAARADRALIVQKKSRLVTCFYFVTKMPRQTHKSPTHLKDDRQQSESTRATQNCALFVSRKCSHRTKGNDTKDPDQ